MTMRVELNAEERTELAILLEEALGQLSHEIADTDNAGYRRRLRARRAALTAIARRLGSPDAAGHRRQAGHGAPVSDPVALSSAP